MAGAPSPSSREPHRLQSGLRKMRLRGVPGSGGAAHLRQTQAASSQPIGGACGGGLPWQRGARLKRRSSSARGAVWGRKASLPAVAFGTRSPGSRERRAQAPALCAATSPQSVYLINSYTCLAHLKYSVFDYLA